MITPYFPGQSGPYYEQYIREQIGEGVQVYGGSTIHRGHGIGSVVSGLVRSTIPMLKSVGRSLGKELLTTGSRIASDLLGGDDVGKSTARHAKAASSRLLDRLDKHVNSRPRPRANKRPHVAKSTKRKRPAKTRSLFKNVDVAP